MDMSRTLFAIAFSVLGPAMISGQGQDSKPVVYSPGAGVVAPKVVKSVTPTYTPEARAARIQGTVTVEAVVLPDGKVGDVTVAKSELWPYLGPSSKDAGTVVLLSLAEVMKLGLDKQALKAAKQWVFQPGRKDGKPVAVRIQIGLRFALGAA
jgi:hypothetical protein